MRIENLLIFLMNAVSYSHVAKNKINIVGGRMLIDRFFFCRVFDLWGSPNLEFQKKKLPHKEPLDKLSCQI